MATVVIPNTFVPSTVARASEVNANFTAVTAQVNGNLEAANLANNAVTTVKILDANVTTAKIADANVTTAKIADANVTTTKIADANVTNAKIATGVDAAKLTTGTLPIARIADGAVSTAKIADAAVTTAKLGTISIGTSQIADSAVTTVKVADGAITPTKLSGFLFAGYVGIDGTAGNSLPTGWSASKTSTGTYRVTHALGTSAIRFACSPTLPAMVGVNTSVTSYATVYFRDASDVLEDHAFHFIAVVE